MSSFGLSCSHTNVENASCAAKSQSVHRCNTTIFQWSILQHCWHFLSNSGLRCMTKNQFFLMGNTAKMAIYICLYSMQWHSLESCYQLYFQYQQSITFEKSSRKKAPLRRKRGWTFSWRKKIYCTIKILWLLFLKVMLICSPFISGLFFLNTLILNQYSVRKSQTSTPWVVQNHTGIVHCMC